MEYNPRLHEKPLRRKKVVNFGGIDSPINAQIKDPENIRKTYKELPLIPFAGSETQSADGLLHFFNSGRYISGTLGACHESIKTYTLGEKLDVVRVGDLDFWTTDNEDVPDAIKTAFVEFLKEKVIVDKGTYKEISECMFSSYKDNGNIFVEVIHSETLGVKKSAIHFHETEDCKYYATEDGEPLKIVISKQWDFDYLRQHPPRIVPKYPNYSQDEDGTLRTIIHVKHGSYRWYGRPDWSGAWINVYREYQDSDYLVKMSANNFTGQVLIELEDEETMGEDSLEEQAAEAGYGSTIERMEANLTTKADDPQTIMLITRPYGAKNAFVHEFKVNTNENFYKVSNEINRQKIIENNQWSERLLGNAVGEGFATDAFISELRVKDISVLSNYRAKITNIFNLVFADVIKFNEAREFEGIGVEFMSSIESLKDNEDDNNGLGGGVVQPGS